MKIAVCIKQVPASSNVKVDPVTGVLIRSNTNNKMNPYDLYAIETALRIKEKLPNVTVSVISMGPFQAKEILMEALWMGCDEAYLLSDRKFAGSDVLATSQALSQGLLHIGDIDLVICGKQTTDGDTAQVGSEIAELLGFPQATYVCDIESVTNNYIVVKTNNENHYEILKVELPCLITVEKDIYTPRLPSYKRGKDLLDYEVKVITFNDLANNDENLYGLNGSATQVEKIFSPEKNTQRNVVEGSPSYLAQVLLNDLRTNKYL
ncbi:MAG TPA: electron transfer flavoprotein subunit beta/FixA family protein [Haloplasmataceae bacterium]